MKHGGRIPFHRRFSFRTFSALAGIAIIAVIVTAASLSIVSSAAMRRNVLQRNLQIARRAAEEINLYITDSFNFLQSLAEMLMPVKDLWVADLILENAAVAYGKYEEIHLIDGEMAIIASSELDNRRAVFDRDFLADSAGERRLRYSDVTVSAEGLPYLKVAVPTGSAPWPRIYAQLNLREI